MTFANVFIIVTFAVFIGCQGADSANVSSNPIPLRLQWLPNDVVDCVFGYCDNIIMCRLSEADKANQGITEKTRKNRKKQMGDIMLIGMYRAVRSLQEVHVKVALPHLQCKALRNTSTVLAAAQFLLAVCLTRAGSHPHEK